MSTLLDPVDRSYDQRTEADTAGSGDDDERPVTPAPERVEQPRPSPAITARRIGVLVALWLVVLLTSVAAVAYGLGSVLEHRHQRVLLRDFRAQVDNAANAVQSLRGYQPPTVAPEKGSPVAIVDIGRLGLQQVVVEGAGSGQTEKGPGHVSGTAGPGQPGNSVVVGRRLGFGGPFNHLDQLRRGDRIVITTPQGQSLYQVETVSDRSIGADTYQSSQDDRLTLLTTSTAMPGSANPGTKVTAKMVGVPFEPTPQGALSPSSDGRQGDASVWPLLVLLGIGLAGAAAAATVLYRRWRPLSTYLLTAPALIALTVLVGEAAVRLLPAWT